MRTLTIGESLIDIVVDQTGNTKKYPGGSPMNVAIALGRLGHESKLLTRISSDDLGQIIIKHLDESNVHLSPGSDNARGTSTATATIDENGSASYEFKIDWDLPCGRINNGFKAVHTSSIASVLEPGASKVYEAIESFQKTATISYDPNVRPTLMGTPEVALPKITALVELADVVKLSDEDAAWLYPDLTIEEVATSWLNMGPAFVVVTKGGEGAYALCRGGSTEVAPVKVGVVDTVGAGDTFSAGLLDALAEADLVGSENRERLRAISPNQLHDIATHAAKLAAVTVSRAGANPPWSHELEG